MKMDDRKIMHDNCFINNIWFYHKSNLIRAPLEALITIYLAEIAMMFSKWFVNRKNLDAPQIALMVFIPLLFSLIVCLLYSGGVIILVNKKIYKLIDEFKPDMNNEYMEALYKKINEEVKCTFRLIHIIGTICYLVVGIIVSFVFVNKIFIGYNENNILIISLYCLFMGAMWNVYGYFSDRRIDWSKIYIKLNVNIGEVDDIQKEKYSFYRKSVRWQIISIAMITFILVLVFIRFDYDVIPTGSFDIMITYSAFVAWFITILKIYCSQMFSMFFTHKEKGSEIFPSESEILICNK